MKIRIKREIKKTKLRAQKGRSLLQNEGFGKLFSYTLNFFRNKIQGNNFADKYQKWIQEVESNWFERSVQNSSNIKSQIKISIIMPTFNIGVEYLKKAVDSVLDQTYETWELCIYDDGSEGELLKDTIIQYSKKDDRIKVQFGKENKNISYASNQALKLATGEYVLFMDHDDELSKVALAEIINVFQDNPATDVVYYDEDVISEDSERIFPIFKPNWSPETLLSIMYLTHATYRREVVEKVGKLRIGYEGSQDYDLILRVSEITDKIIHIPHILYHWRQLPGSTALNYSEKSFAQKSAIKALEDTIQRRGLDANVQQGFTPFTFRIKYNIKNNPKVSIIIPIKDKVELLKKCIQSIENKTEYQTYEIIIVDNASSQKETLEYLKKCSGKYTVLKYPHEYNFSAINNFATKTCNSDYFLFLNNDIEILSNGWLTSMLEHAQRSEIGVVGAILLYENDKVQHVGVVIGMGGTAGHMYRFLDATEGGILERARIVANTSAVTAACMMVRKKLFDEIGGFDEKLGIALNDIDLSLKLHDKGYRNIYTPYAKTYHFESQSRGYELTKEKKARSDYEADIFKSRWEKYIENDPYYNQNLSLETEQVELKF